MSQRNRHIRKRLRRKASARWVEHIAALTEAAIDPATAEKNWYQLLPRHRRAILWKAQEGRCALCGEAIDLSLPSGDPLSATIDHIRPQSRGGPTTRKNSQLAHEICNRRKGNAFSGATCGVQPGHPLQTPDEAQTSDPPATPKDEGDCKG